MKRVRLIPVLLAVTLLATETPADNRRRTVAFDLVAANYPESDALSLSQRLRTELSALERFAVLQPLDAHSTECRTVPCLSRIAREQKAERAVSGRVERIDRRRIHLQAQLIDVAAERVLRTVTRAVDDDLEDLLRREIPDIARELAGIREQKSNATLWLFLAGTAGTAAYLFTRDGDQNDPSDENGRADITGTFPSPR